MMQMLCCTAGVPAFPAAARGAGPALKAAVQVRQHLLGARGEAGLGCVLLGLAVGAACRAKSQSLQHNSSGELRDWRKPHSLSVVAAGEAVTYIPAGHQQGCLQLKKASCIRMPASRQLDTLDAQQLMKALAQHSREAWSSDYGQG